jgi:hypothetical protein
MNQVAVRKLFSSAFVPVGLSLILACGLLYCKDIFRMDFIKCLFNAFSILSTFYPPRKPATAAIFRENKLKKQNCTDIKFNRLKGILVIRFYQ